MDQKKSNRLWFQMIVLAAAIVAVVGCILSFNIKNAEKAAAQGTITSTGGEDQCTSNYQIFSVIDNPTPPPGQSGGKTHGSVPTPPGGQ